MPNCTGTPTCFVAMGFGKKTDFETGRVLDLNASYQNLIKPAVANAGLECIRADEIKHSGLIDDPMYDQLLNADVVIADLSTSNRNAIYELGVRHALRPYTTIVIAEEGLLKSPFFDLSHIVIRTYRHLGEDIGVSEMKRFTEELTTAIKEILRREMERRLDSPVYKFLQRLKPPFISNADAAKQDDPPSTSLAIASDTVPPAYSELLSRVDEAQKAGDWLRAKMLLEEIRVLRKGEIEKSRQKDEEKSKTAKLENPDILQRLALATYKSKYPNPEEALKAARDLLLLLEPRTSNDTETLGLWGSVHKQLWELTRDRNYLDESVRGYQLGFYLRNDYYNGINFAFLLNVRAAHADAPAEAIADFVQARRVRAEVIEICERWLQANPGPADNDPKVLENHRERKYWVIATLAEAHIGLGDTDEGSRRLAEAYSIDCAGWMKEATGKQLAALEPLLANSPLKRIS